MNSGLTSLGDSTRPIIFFGIFLAVFASSMYASTNTRSLNPAIRRLEPREHQRARLLNEVAARAVDLVTIQNSGITTHHGGCLPRALPAGYVALR